MTRNKRSILKKTPIELLLMLFMLGVSTHEKDKTHIKGTLLPDNAGAS